MGRLGTQGEVKAKKKTKQLNGVKNLWKNPRVKRTQNANSHFSKEDPNKKKLEGGHNLMSGEDRTSPKS